MTTLAENIDLEREATAMASDLAAGYVPSSKPATAPSADEVPLTEEDKTVMDAELAEYFRKRSEDRNAFLQSLSAGRD